MPKSVLVICYDFPPQGGTGTIRVAKFARYLPEFGWQPVVVCSDAMWNYDASLLREVPPQSEVHRVSQPGLFRGGRALPGTAAESEATGGRARPGGLGALKRRLSRALGGIMVPDPCVPWVPGAVSKCAAIIEHNRIDAVLTTSPPHSVQLAGHWLKQRFPYLPWVADYRDPWSQSHRVFGRAGYYPNFQLERACNRRADRILVVTEGLRQQTLEKFPGVAEDRVITVTNGYDPADLADLPDCERNERFTMLFAGTFYEPRSCTQFIPALLELAQDEQVRQKMRVRFVGGIPAVIQRQLQPLLTQGVATVRPAVAHDVALAEMARADVLLLLEADIPELRISHSNKLFEYLATGNPILAVAGEGEISRLILENQAGIIAHPDDRSQIKTTILELLRRYEAGELHHTVPAESLARFERRNLTRRLAEILDDLTGLRS